MYLVAIAWMYVVLMMAVAEATSPQGTVLGALVTFVLYGVLPLSVLLYILGTPMRARARKAREALEAQRAASGASGAEAIDPDQAGHAAGDTVAPVRKVP